MMSIHLEEFGQTPPHSSCFRIVWQYLEAFLLLLFLFKRSRSTNRRGNSKPVERTVSVHLVFTYTLEVYKSYDTTPSDHKYNY